jgi:hypothetical protein
MSRPNHGSGRLEGGQRAAGGFDRHEFESFEYGVALQTVVSADINAGNRIGISVYFASIEFRTGGAVLDLSPRSESPGATLQTRRRAVAGRRGRP